MNQLLKETTTLPLQHRAALLVTLVIRNSRSRRRLEFTAKCTGVNPTFFWWGGWRDQRPERGAEAEGLGKVRSPQFGGAEAMPSGIIFNLAYNLYILVLFDVVCYFWKGESKIYTLAAVFFFSGGSPYSSPRHLLAGVEGDYF